MNHEMPETSGTNPRVPTKEELVMIRDAVMLPMMLDIADRNRQQIERSSHTLKALYSKAVLVVMDEISSDLAKVRKELRQRNIKVIEDGQRDQVIYNRFICRGYEERFGMVREVVKAEIGVRFGEYIGRAFKKE